MQADAAVAPELLFLLLTTTGLACLSVGQWRALRRHHRRQQEWLQREERFRTPLEQTEDYTIFMLGRSGRPTSWSVGVRRVLGYERPEFLRLSVRDLYMSEDQENGAPERELAEAAEHGRVTGERWMVRKDGSRFWASVALTAVHDRHGELIGYSQRLRDQSRSREMEQQLRRQQEALELALEAAGLGTWEYDLGTGEMRWDERAKALFGLPGDATLTHPGWIEGLHPGDRDSTRYQWERAVRDRSPFSAEYRVILPDGGIHSIMALGRATGEQLAGVMLDLTERRRSEEQMQETLRMEAVGRLAGGIAHDLNNMLAAILGFSELLERNLDLDDPRREDTRQISRAAERSAGLTRQLLAFARRELIQPQLLDVNAVVRHTAPMISSILGENIVLSLRLAPDPLVVYADPRQVEQTLMNLIINARDAMPQGGRVTVETRSDLEGGSPGRFATLAVSDTGYGMDAATLQRMWEPFFTTKPAGHGTGLGLSSVYGSVKQGGGFVRAESEPGRGTTVQVHWPEVRSAPEPLHESSGEPEVRGGSERILVVEDEPLVRELVVRALRDHGYHCLEAPDAAEALRLVERGEVAVDMVITDVVMPGMSGGGLGDRLAVVRPDLPVLFTSAYVDEDVINRGLLEQGRPFLQKPCSPRVLARKVREVLDARPAVYSLGARPHARDSGLQ